MNARITSSDEKYSTGFSEKAISPNDRQLDRGIQYLKNTYSGTPDFNLQQPEECDDSGEHLPMTEATESEDTKDFISLLSSDYHSGHHNELTRAQECLDGGEETDLFLHDSKLNEQEKLSPVIIDEVLYREPCQWSSTEQQSEDSISDSCLNISETPLIVQADTRQLSEIEVLDNNANPDFSQSIVTVPCFSTQDTKRIKDKQSEKSKSETIENDTLLPVTTEHTEKEHCILFSQQEDFQNLSNECKFSNSNVLEKENTEPNEKVYSFTSSGDAYLFREGQVRDIGEDETTQNTNTTPLCKDTKHIDDVTEPPEDKQYILTGKELELSHSDITPAALSKKYHLTAQDSHCDQVHEKTQVTDNKNVVSETGDPMFSSVRAVYVSEKESSVPDFSPSVARTAAENATQSTFHEWNAILGSFPSEQTQGSKVIIAKITEEKGQSQTRSQDRQGSNGSFIDIGDSETIRAQQEIDEKSKEKVTFVSEKNIELMSEDFISGNKKRVENLAEENNSHLCTEDIHYGGAAHISRGQYELEHYDSRSNCLVGESVVEHEVPNKHSSNGFTPLGQDLDVRLEEDVAAEKETVDSTELSQLMINDDIENTDDVQANMEEGYVGPSILISEPDDDEEDAQYLAEEQSKLEDAQYYYHHDQTTGLEKQIQTGTVAAESINMGHVSSKVFCFIMFVVFAGLMYHFDFLVCFALYLFSLYWLYWEGGRSENPVRKE